MTENAGTDPRVAAAEQEAEQDTVLDATGAPDQTELAEEGPGSAGAYGGVDVADVVDERDGRA